MNINQAFPSNFLKADDLQGKSVQLKIIKVEFEKIGSGHDKENKLVISFAGKTKKLICNKTNARTITKVTKSDDTDKWIGKEILLETREVEFQGEMVWALRVSLLVPGTANVASAPRPSPIPSAPEPSQVQPGDANSDDVPF